MFGYPFGFGIGSGLFFFLLRKIRIVLGFINFGPVLVSDGSVSVRFSSLDNMPRPIHNRSTSYRRMI